MRRSLLPGMRYPCSAPESNHLLTVRGATLQILATSPVVRTSLTFVVALIALFSLRTPMPRPSGRGENAVDTVYIDSPRERFRTGRTFLRIYGAGVCWD